MFQVRSHVDLSEMSADQTRVKSEEFEQAVCAIEARKAERPDQTVLIGRRLRRLDLDITADEVLAEIEWQRTHPPVSPQKPFRLPDPAPAGARTGRQTALGFFAGIGICSLVFWPWMAQDNRMMARTNRMLMAGQFGVPSRPDSSVAVSEGRPVAMTSSLMTVKRDGGPVPGLDAPIRNVTPEYGSRFLGGSAQGRRNGQRGRISKMDPFTVPSPPMMAYVNGSLPAVPESSIFHARLFLPVAHTGYGSLSVPDQTQLHVRAYPNGGPWSMVRHGDSLYVCAWIRQPLPPTVTEDQPVELYSDPRAPGASPAPVLVTLRMDRFRCLYSAASGSEHFARATVFGLQPDARLHDSLPPVTASIH